MFNIFFFSRVLDIKKKKQKMYASELKSECFNFLETSESIISYIYILYINIPKNV